MPLTIRIRNEQIVPFAFQTAATLFGAIVQTLPVQYILVLALASQIGPIYVVVMHQQDASLSANYEHVPLFVIRGGTLIWLHRPLEYLPSSFQRICKFSINFQLKLRQVDYRFETVS